jgi:hypothetical protein
MTVAARLHQRNGSSIDDRSDERHSIRLTALIITKDAGPEMIQILNIARLGFLARAMRPRQTGEDIVVHIDPLGRCEAQIIWSEAGQFGGRFVAPIDIAALV